MLAAAGAAIAAPALADEPLRWQIGCYTRPWAAHDYRVALDGIAAAGFKYVGLMTAKSKDNLLISVNSTPEEAAAVGAEVKQRGLKVISLWGGQFPTDGPAGLKRLIDNSAACGCPHLMLGGTSEKLASRVLQDRRRLLRLRPGQRRGAQRQAARRLQPERRRSAARSSTASATRTSASGTTPATSSSTPTASSTPWTTPRQSTAW